MAKDWTGNVSSIYKAIGATAHSLSDREKDDFYATDPLAIDKLIKEIDLPLCVWECACGSGHLSERLKYYGHEVHSTDLRERGYGIGGIDFLKENRFDCSKMAIVTNPPYKYATEFVYHALEILKEGELLCMFLKLTFLEGKARRELFKKSPPHTVLVFSERIKCAKNGDFESISSSAVAYAWFVWQKGYKGVTTIRWI